MNTDKERAQLSARAFGEGWAPWRTLWNVTPEMVLGVKTMAKVSVNALSDEPQEIVLIAAEPGKPYLVTHSGGGACPKGAVAMRAGQAAIVLAAGQPPIYSSDDWRTSRGRPLRPGEAVIISG